MIFKVFLLDNLNLCQYCSTFTNTIAKNDLPEVQIILDIATGFKCLSYFCQKNCLMSIFSKEFKLKTTPFSE